MSQTSKPLKLRTPKRGWLGVPPCTCQHYVDAARVCLANADHSRTVILAVSGDTSTMCELQWDKPTQRMLNAHNDHDDAAEHGAHAVAFLMVELLTPYTAILQSRKGTGVDWFLGNKKKTLFQQSARLEISGMLNGDDARFSARIREKLIQTRRSDATALPAYVSVSEFGTPRICFKQRNANEA